MLLKSKAHLSDLTPSIYQTSGNKLDLSIYLIQSIANEFQQHCQLAQENLLEACLHKPVYGPLAAIHSLMITCIKGNKSLLGSNSPELEQLRSICARLIQLCLQVSQVTGKIVNSSSPEGIFPTELAQMQPHTQASDECLKSVTPQMLLVCCWRTMKEISLFFGDLVSQLPVEHDSDEYFLSERQVFEIGEYFVSHLLETRHRGAFELAYVGFTNMCQTFWR
jgi:hypothetical protein